MPDLRTAGKVLVLAALALMLVATAGFSTALFTSSSRSTGTVTAASDWTPPTVALQEGATVVRGVVDVGADASDADSGIAEVRLASSPRGADRWADLCFRATAPYVCSWDTATVADGAYDLRAAATDRAGNSAEAGASRVVTVDNTPPAVTLHDPGSSLSGTTTFEATASDVTSDVVRVVLEYAPAGTTTWATLCSLTAAPWVCEADTTALEDDTYSFRAVATDRAGNIGISVPVTGSDIDNRPVSTVQLSPVDAVVRATVPLSAQATSTAGVSSLRIQYAAAGTSAWNDICTGAAASLTCGWDTSTVANGLYDMRALLLDGSGQVTASGVVTGRRVDNAPTSQFAPDVQSTNTSGGTAGLVERGDTITFTYPSVIPATSVSPGWTGEAREVTVRLSDGRLVNRSDTQDALEVVGTSAPVHLGSVNLNASHISHNQVLSFTGTMRLGTVRVDGVLRSTVTVVIGDLTTGNVAHLRTAAAGQMVWTDAQGRVTHETGALDVDF